MNRFTADGLIQEALDGKRVLVLDQTQQMCHNSFYAVMDRVEHHGLTCNKWVTVGRMAVAFGIGGRIDFNSIQSRLHGRSADIVLVNNIYDRSLLERVWRDGSLHSLVRFTDGELVVE